MIRQIELGENKEMTSLWLMVIGIVKVFGIVNKAERDVFSGSLLLFP